MNRRTKKTTKKHSKKLKGGFLGPLLMALAPSLIGPAVSAVSNLIQGKNMITGQGGKSGGRYLIERNQLGMGKKKRKGGAKTSPWIQHVKDYMNRHNCSYKEALSGASSTYK